LNFRIYQGILHKKLLEVRVTRRFSIYGASFLIATFALLASGCKTTPVEDPNFLGNYPPRELDTFMGNSIPQGKNELIPREITTTFYPNGNAVEWNTHYEMNFVTVTLMPENREAMFAAMERYIAEHQDGKLTAENSKKKAYFGSTEAFIQWGLLGPSYYAKPVLRFEYQIVDNGKPYFVIGNASSPVTNVDGKMIKDGGNSPALRLAFSPIQCQNLIETLNQEALLKIVRDLDAEAALFDIPAETVPSDGSVVEKKELF